jgi:hypothetical protein
MKMRPTTYWTAAAAAGVMPAAGVTAAITAVNAKGFIPALVIGVLVGEACAGHFGLLYASPRFGAGYLTALPWFKEMELDHGDRQVVADANATAVIVQRSAAITLATATVAVAYSRYPGRAYVDIALAGMTVNAIAWLSEVVARLILGSERAYDDAAEAAELRAGQHAVSS